MSANVLNSLDDREVIRQKIAAIRKNWSPEERIERRKAGQAGLLFLLAIASDAEKSEASPMYKIAN